MNRNARDSRRRSDSWFKRQIHQRPLPAWLLVAIDVLLIGICLVVFALFHHVIPRRETSTGMVSSRYANETVGEEAAYKAETFPVANESGESVDSVVQGADDAAQETIVKEPEISSEPAAEEETVEMAPEATEIVEEVTGYFGNRFPDKFTDGKVIKTGSSYQSANVNIALSKHEYEGATFYYADIYVKDIECLRTEFADGQFSRGRTEWPVDMNRRAGGVLAVNGDYYGTRTDGVVIRNGELYRDKDVTMDVCVIYWDGIMETYSAHQFRARAAMESGAYQAWHFGPRLLDDEGKPLRNFSNASLGPKNPRTVLGYFEPGHYCFVVVDGRSSTSSGLTIKELAKLMSQIGCKRAYNMDGGATSMMVIGDKVVSNPYNGGRPSSDIILIADK